MRTFANSRLALAARRLTHVKPPIGAQSYGVSHDAAI